MADKGNESGRRSCKDCSKTLSRQSVSVVCVCGQEFHASCSKKWLTATPGVYKCCSDRRSNRARSAEPAAPARVPVQLPIDEVANQPAPILPDAFDAPPSYENCVGQSKNAASSSFSPETSSAASASSTGAIPKIIINKKKSRNADETSSLASGYHVDSQELRHCSQDAIPSSQFDVIVNGINDIKMQLAAVQTQNASLS